MAGGALNPPACFTKKDCLLLIFDDLQHLRRCHHYWLLRIVFEVTCVLVKNQAINGQAANSSSAEAVSGMSCLRAKFLEEWSISTSPSPCIRMRELY